MKGNPDYRPDSENSRRKMLSGPDPDPSPWLPAQAGPNPSKGDASGPDRAGNDGLAVNNGRAAAGIDPWSIGEALVKRWYWLILAGVVCGVAAAYAGREYWRTTYTASVQLIRSDSPMINEVMRDRASPMQTLADLLRSPDLMQRAAGLAKPPISPDTLGSSLVITPERNKESMTIAVTDSSPEVAADLANLFAVESVSYIKELQRRELASVNEHLLQQLGEIDGLMREFDDRLRQPIPEPIKPPVGPVAATEPVREVEAPVPVDSLSSLTRSMLLEQIRVAHQELATLLTHYTEENAQVKAQKLKIDYLEKSYKETLAAAGPSSAKTNAANGKPLVASTGSGQGQGQGQGQAQVQAQAQGQNQGPAQGQNPGTAQVSTNAATNAAANTAANVATNVAAPVLQQDRDSARNRLAALEAARLPLASRQRMLQDLVDDPPGQLQVLIPARPPTALKHGRDLKIAAVTGFGGILGVALAAGLVLLGEAMGRRLKTEDDVRRVTQLPVIASVGNLRGVSGAKREELAFLAWTAVERRLSSGPEPGLLCGIISSSEGEGRATWTQLLAQAASQRGYRVLTINTQGESRENGLRSRLRSRSRARAHPRPRPNGNGKPNGAPTAQAHQNPNADADEGETETASVLSSPGDVVHQLIGPNAQVSVEIELPAWTWNRERRRQLEAALSHWRNIEDVVILITLPPASDPQAVLLAGEMTNLVWLTDSGRAKAASTRRQVEILRHNRCRLVGAVLNHAPSRPLRNLFPRWVPA
jgi:capsular polysaccharide biosynthesis protein